MKIFKRIYYPVMAALLALMLVFGLVDATYSSPKDNFSSDFYVNVNKNIEVIAENSHNSYNPVNHEDVREHIVSYLVSAGARNVNASKDDSGYDIAEFYKDGTKPMPTVTVQNTIVTQATMDNMDNLGGNEIFVNKEINNIIAAIPGTDTINTGKGKAIILMAHYDSVPMGPGASDDGIAVAALMENFKHIISQQLSFKNDLIFVFTDAEEEDLYGAYAFKYQFRGFNNVFSRAELGANFESLGTGGTMLMFQTSKNNSKLVSEYAKINGATYTSSIAGLVYSTMPNYTDFDIFGDILSLDFANVGEAENYHTASDNVENVSQHIVKGQANAIYNFYNHFGNMELSSLKSTSDSVYFSYLDIMTVVYPFVVAFVIGGLILGLLLAIILVNMKKKSFSWGKVGGGIAVQLVTVLATILVLFVGYFAVTLLLSAFGVIPVSSIMSLSYSSVGLIVSILFFGMAAAFTFYILLKKAFNVKAIDVVRGNAVILGVIGAILSFALPQASYFFAFIGILSLAVMLINTCLKDKFKNKFGMDIERLFLYAWPIVICLPMMVPPIMIASSILSALLIPVIVSLFVIIFGGIAPYFDYVKPVFDKGAQKLPMRTIRVERTVTERIEDKAKKGKFTEQTVKKVTNEKINWRYKNRFGISVIAVLSFVAIMCFTAFGGSFTSGIAGRPSYVESVYNDSLVYVWDKTSGSVVEQLVVKDHMAYKFISRAVSDLKWDAEQKAYVKSYSASSHIATAPTVTKTNKTYTFNVYDKTRSAVTIKLTGTKNIEEFTFAGAKGESVTYTNNGEDERTFLLPYGYGNFTMTTDEAAEITVEYTEYRMGSEAIASITDWVKLLEYYAGEDIYSNLRGGIVLKYSQKL